MMILGAHMVGDFILQNDWMQRKSSSSLVCLVHVLVYLLPFCFLLNWWQLILVGVQHFMWDRWSVARRWQIFWKQTPPSKWMSGPLWVDQAWHIAWLASVSSMTL